MRKLKLNKESKKDLLDTLLKRSPNHYRSYEGQVAEILNEVREKKDMALFEFTKRFDGASISAATIQVTQEEIEEAYTLVEPSLIEVIKKALVNIKAIMKSKNNIVGLIVQRKGQF